MKNHPYVYCSTTCKKMFKLDFTLSFWSIKWNFRIKKKKKSLCIKLFEGYLPHFTEIYNYHVVPQKKTTLKKSAKWNSIIFICGSMTLKCLHVNFITPNLISLQDMGAVNKIT